MFQRNKTPAGNTALQDSSAKLPFNPTCRIALQPQFPNLAHIARSGLAIILTSLKIASVLRLTDQGRAAL